MEPQNILILILVHKIGPRFNLILNNLNQDL
jgi:hypothetical protein